MGKVTLAGVTYKLGSKPCDDPGWEGTDTVTYVRGPVEVSIVVTPVVCASPVFINTPGVPFSMSIGVSLITSCIVLKTFVCKKRFLMVRAL